MSNKQVLSLWELEAESEFVVTAIKIKDTTSMKEAQRWVNKDINNVVSFYREENELNAMYLQTLELND